MHKTHIPTKVITIRSREKAFMNNSTRKLTRKRNIIHISFAKIWWSKKQSYCWNKGLSRQIDKKKLANQIDKFISLGKCWRIVKYLSKQNKKNKSTAPLKSSNHVFFQSMKKLTCSTSILLVHELLIINYCMDQGLQIFLLDDFNITKQEVLDQLQVLNVKKPSDPVCLNLFLEILQNLL